MRENPLPWGSGIGRATGGELVSQGCHGHAPKAAARHNCSFPPPGSFNSARQAGVAYLPGSWLSNATPTITTKSILGANRAHPLSPGVSVKMSGVVSAHAIPIFCAPVRKDDWAP
jgi:hypothetical protein